MQCQQHLSMYRLHPEYASKPVISLETALRIQCWNYNAVIRPKDADGMENTVEPGLTAQTAPSEQTT